MPVANPLKVTKTSKVPRRLVDDMPRRNDLLLNKEVITSVSRMVNPSSLLHFFSNLGGVMRGSEEQEKMFDVQYKGIGSEYIRMRKYREQMIPAKVVDSSLVPDTLVAGQNFVVTQDKFIGEGGEQVLLKDMKSMLMVQSYRASADGKNFEYTYQYQNQQGKTASGSLLSVDSPINYGFGNSVGEASLTGNTLVDDGERFTDTYNVMQIARYVIPRTGSALADDTFAKVSVIEAIDGTEVAMDYVTDLPMRGAKTVFANIDRAIMFNVPNFSVATRHIANRANVSRYPERPTYAGLFYQWDLAPYQWDAYASAPLSEGVQLLKDILSFKRNGLGTGKRYIAYCMGAGRQWLKEVFGEAVKIIGYQITIQVDDAAKLGGGKIGFDIDEYVTPDGSISIVDIGYALTQWGEFNLTTYGNVGYTSRSNKIYLQPVTVGDGNGGKTKPATIFAKEANGYSRAFVMGLSKGITGANGLGGAAMAALQEDALKRMMSNEKLRIDSTVDAEEIHVLSQICPFMDTDTMSVINLLP